MSIKETAKTSVTTEAERLKTIAIHAQVQVDKLVAVAEEKARKNLKALVGIDSAVHTPDLVDANIVSKDSVISPQLMEEVLPLSEQAASTTRHARRAISEILTGTDDRLIVITGPCAIHNADEALKYAGCVNEWRKKYSSNLEIVMRAYYEKPRTELGWKGLVYDPLLDGSDDINLGLTLARLTSLRITEMGVPVATERLKALTPQYQNGLVAYDAIGARNTTNQGSREYASGTSSPIGFKNTTDGGVQDAMSAIVTANNPQSFLGTSMSGLPANIRTRGNALAHIILRGGKDGPNFAKPHIAETLQQLEKKGLLKAIVVDASHGNSGKDASRQKVVVKDIASQLADGQESIKGVMLESNLVHGKQNLKPGGNPDYGVSIVDECIGLDETEKLLKMLAEGVATRRLKVVSANGRN